MQTLDSQEFVYLSNIGYLNDVTAQEAEVTKPTYSRV